jgi:abnormal spindle-like microcephaly-associated protein
VDQGRITIRRDRLVHADVGIRQNIVNLLMCYSPQWLKLGLEVLYSTIIPKSSDSTKLGRFITSVGYVSVGVLTLAETFVR